MKKILTIALTVFLLMVLSLSAFAANAAVECTTVGEIAQGNEITVTVSVKNTDPFKSMFITPKYDTDKFELVSGEWLLKDAPIANFNGTSGVIAFSTENNSTGDVFKYVLKVMAEAVTGETVLGADVMIKSNAGDIATDVNSAKVKVICSAHTFGEWATTTAPTCTAEGSKTRVCSVCAKEETEALAAEGHAMSEWKTSKAATCTAKGEQVKECSKCDYKETKALNALGHNYGTPVLTKEATCKDKGVETSECTRCGNKKTADIALKAHTYGDPVVEKQPTTTVEGIKASTCKVCGDVKKEAIPVLPPEQTEPATSAPETTVAPATTTPDTQDAGNEGENRSSLVVILIILIAVAAIAVIAFVIFKKKK